MGNDKTFWLAVVLGLLVVICVPLLWTHEEPKAVNLCADCAVDYSKSAQELFDAGHFVSSDSAWSYFEVADVKSLKASQGKTLKYIEVVNFGYLGVETPTVLKYFKERGLRPLDLNELLAFGATHAKSAGLIVGLGFSTKDKDGYACVPYVSNGSDGINKVGFRWSDLRWDGNCFFAATRD